MEQIVIFLSSVRVIFPCIQNERVKWNSFRRPNYFVSRQHDCYQRFRRIVGTFSKDVQDSDLLANMERKRNMLLNPPGIVVISNEPDSNVLEGIQMEKVSQSDGDIKSEETQQSDTCCVTLLLCHIIVHKLDEWKEIVNMCVEQLLKLWTLDEVDKSMFAMIIICDIKTADIPQEINSEVHRYITDYLSQPSSCIERSPQVLVGHETSKIQEKIDIALEDTVMTMFDCIYSYVERFIVPSHRHSRPSETMSRTSDVTSLGKQTTSTVSAGVKDDAHKRSTSSETSREGQEKLVDEAISGCLSQDNWETFKGRESSDVTEDDVASYVLPILADRIRCAILPTLALRFRLFFWICNQIFTDLKFTDRVAKAASPETRQSICGIYTESKTQSEPDKSKFLVNVKKDVAPVLELVEKTLSRAEGFIDIMRRLQHEVRGYFSQSLTRKGALHRIPALSSSFKTDITQIPNVFGVGTVFGDCEVHVTALEPEEFSKVKASVDIVAKKHSVTFPVRIKQVRNVVYNHR